MSYSLWPQEWQHAGLHCPSLSLGARSNSCPLNQWCHPTISSSVDPFSSCPQSFPASGSFPISQLFTSGGQSTRALASAPVLLMTIQSWFLLGLVVWSPCYPGDSQKSSPLPQFKNINSSAPNLLYGPTLTSIRDNWKSHAFDYMNFVGKVMSLFLFIYFVFNFIFDISLSLFFVFFAV